MEDAESGVLMSEEELILSLSDEDAEYAVVLSPDLFWAWIDRRKVV